MRKKIVLFFVSIAIILGLIIGIKNVNLDLKVDSSGDSIVETANEIYRDELNLSVSEVDSLNPLKTKNIQVASMLKLIYEPLIGYKSNEEIDYILAESYAKLDSKTWIIKLREDISWHDGNSFTANDVIFTFNMIRNNDFVYSSILKNVDIIEKIDNNSVKIFLKEADECFINKLTFPIIPEHYFKGDEFNNANKENRPIGTGAYKYVSTTENGGIELSFNTNWWKASNAKLQTIHIYKYATFGEAIKAFKSAQIDMIYTNMAGWKSKFGTIGVNSYSFENSEYEVIIPNCNNVALSENSVRRAILQAINRENIINSVYDDSACISDIPIHTNSKNSIENSEYDIEKAKQILINAGWTEHDETWTKKINEKNFYLNFSLLVNKDSEEKVLVAEKIKENLKCIGINITIIKKSLIEIKDLIKQDKFDLVLMTLDIKNEATIQENVLSSGDLNYANYMSEEMDKIVNKLRIDESNYNQNISDFARLYKNDAPYIGLYFKTSSILTNKSVKGNFEPTWSDYYRNITSFCK